MSCKGAADFTQNIPVQAAPHMNEDVTVFVVLISAIQKTQVKWTLSVYLYSL